MPASRVILTGWSKEIEAWGNNPSQFSALIDPSDQSFWDQLLCSRHPKSPFMQESDTIILAVTAERLVLPWTSLYQTVTLSPNTSTLVSNLQLCMYEVWKTCALHIRTCIKDRRLIKFQSDYLIQLQETKNILEIRSKYLTAIILTSNSWIRGVLGYSLSNLAYKGSIYPRNSSGPKYALDLTSEPFCPRTPRICRSKAITMAVPMHVWKVIWCCDRNPCSGIYSFIKFCVVSVIQQPCWISKTTRLFGNPIFYKSLLCIYGPRFFSYLIL